MRGLMEAHSVAVEAVKPAIQQLPIIVSEFVGRHRHDPIVHFNWHALQWVATIAAVLVIVQGRLGWRSLLEKEWLVPYVAILLPNPLLSAMRGEVGRWIGIIGLMMRLFTPQIFSPEFDTPLALLLLLIVAPGQLLDLKDSPAAIALCLIISLFVLWQYVNEVGSLRVAMTDKYSVTATLLLIIMNVVPILMLIMSLT